MCLNCLWLPFLLTMNQPSCSIIFMTSFTFTIDRFYESFTNFNDARKICISQSFWKWNFLYIFLGKYERMNKTARRKNNENNPHGRYELAGHKKGHR
jgi:hypothetical protein